MHPETLRRRGLSTERARPGRLPGYRLVFDTPGIPVLEPAFASVSSADDEVWGAVYDMSEAELCTLGSFEGDQYEEIGIRVEVDGEVLGARTFVTRGPGVERLPSRRYVRVLTEGARLRGLPTAWITRLERTPSLYLPLVHDVWKICFRQVDYVHRRITKPSKRT